MQYLVSSSRLPIIATLVFLFSIAIFTLYFSCQRCHTIFENVPETRTKRSANWTGSNSDIRNSVRRVLPKDDIYDQIWKADRNRLKPNDVQYYPGAPQGRPFFTYVNKAALTGTYASMMALFPYYDAFTGAAKSVDWDHKVNVFLDSIINTGPITVLRNWLVAKGLSSADLPFKDELRKYWFKPYIRSEEMQRSSGFGHTFAGEIVLNRNTKQYEVVGLHNWVRMYMEESQKRFIYKDHKDHCEPSIASMSFDWKAKQLGQTDLKTYRKHESSLFIRTSPEVEIALYTVCLLTHQGRHCPIRLDGKPRGMETWWMGSLVKTQVSSSYPKCNP